MYKREKAETGYIAFDGGRIKCYRNQVRSFEPNLSTFVTGAYAYAEQTMMDFIIPNLGDDATFIDIGANIGVYSVVAAKRCKRVYAFEANPEIFEILKENVEPFDNVEIFNVAIGDKEGMVNLHLHKNRGGADSLIRERIALPQRDGFISVESAKLDDYDLQADVIKIDVEGAEMFVVDGGLKTLRRAKLIFMEHHWVKLDDFMRDKGFKDFVWCDEDHLCVMNEVEDDYRKR